MRATASPGQAWKLAQMSLEKETEGSTVYLKASVSKTCHSKLEGIFKKYMPDMQVCATDTCTISIFDDGLAEYRLCQVSSGQKGPGVCASIMQGSAL